MVSRVLASLILGNLTLLNKGFVMKASFYFDVSLGPSISIIRLKVSKSLSPGNRGRPLKISVKMQPRDQMSTLPSY